MKLQAREGQLVPLHPVAVENELVRLAGELEEVTEKMGAQGEAVGQWEVNYKRARAKARLRSEKKSADDREAEAMLESMDEYENFRLGSAVYDAMRDRSITLRVQIEVLRTIAANVRHQAG